MNNNCNDNYDDSNNNNNTASDDNCYYYHNHYIIIIIISSILASLSVPLLFQILTIQDKGFFDKKKDLNSQRNLSNEQTKNRQTRFMIPKIQSERKGLTMSKHKAIVLHIPRHVTTDAFTDKLPIHVTGPSQWNAIVTQTVTQCTLISKDSSFFLNPPVRFWQYAYLSCCDTSLVTIIQKQGYFHIILMVINYTHVHFRLRVRSGTARQGVVSQKRAAYIMDLIPNEETLLWSYSGDN